MVYVHNVERKIKYVGIEFSYGKHSVHDFY